MSILSNCFGRLFGGKPLRVKAGDVARFIGDLNGNDGRRVAVQERAPDWEMDEPAWYCVALQPLTVEGWFGAMCNVGAGCGVIVADAILTPVGDLGQEDETLTWAGKPQPIETPVNAPVPAEVEG